MLGFWLGGASAGTATPPTPPPATTTQGRRHIQWETIRIGLPDAPQYDDDDMTELLGIVVPLL